MPFRGFSRQGSPGTSLAGRIINYFGRLSRFFSVGVGRRGSLPPKLFRPVLRGRAWCRQISAARAARRAPEFAVSRPASSPARRRWEKTWGASLGQRAAPGAAGEEAPGPAPRQVPPRPPARFDPVWRFIASRRVDGPGSGAGAASLGGKLPEKLKKYLEKSLEPIAKSVEMWLVCSRVYGPGRRAADWPGKALLRGSLFHAKTRVSHLCGFGLVCYSFGHGRGRPGRAARGVQRAFPRLLDPGASGRAKPVGARSGPNLSPDCIYRGCF